MNHITLEMVTSDEVTEVIDEDDFQYGLFNSKEQAQTFINNTTQEELLGIKIKHNSDLDNLLTEIIGR